MDISVKNCAVVINRIEVRGNPRYASYGCIWWKSM